MEQILGTITEPQTAIILALIFISGDIITGYLKAFKLKKINSSVSRDGYIKKMGWAVGLVLGLVIKFLTGMDVMLIMTATVCIATEAISMYENLTEIGINLPFKKYFENAERNNSTEKDKEE